MIFHLSSTRSQVFYEAGFFQLGDEAPVHEGFGLVVPYVRALLRDVFISRLQALSDGVGDGDEILLVNFVGAFKQFAIMGFQIFTQDFEAKIFVALQKMNAFHVRFHHPHDAVAIIDGMFAPGDDRHRRIADFLFGIPQDAIAFSLGLNVGGMRKVGGIDYAVI